MFPSLYVLPLLFFLFSSVPCFAQEQITICGTGDSQHLLRLLARAFEDSHPGSTIVVPDSIGSSGGIRLTAQGQCDLGRVARPLKENEKLFDLTYKLFGTSPIVFIVNKSVSISDLTTEQAIAIFSGKIGNWDAITGQDQKIFVARREKGDSSRTVLEQVVPELRKIEEWAGKTTFTTQETVDTVNQYKGTISFIPLAMADGPEIFVLTFNGISPTSENIQTGLYSLSVPLGLVWKGELHGTSKDFVEFIGSPQGQKIIRQTGTIPRQ